jgi:tellurite resistance protein
MDYTGSRKLMRVAYLVMAVDGGIIEDELAEFNPIALLLELHPETFGAAKDRLV